MDPAKLTPEYILEQRRLRNLRKEQERKEKEALGLIPQDEQDKRPLYIKRPLLKVSDGDEGAPKIKIMSYNILAQTLIRRDLFPTNGKILKWSIRSTILLDEIKHYDADIICLQELDKLQLKTFWMKEFDKLGYTVKYHRYNTKNHGVAIIFKSKLFTCKHQSFIKYDHDLVHDEGEVVLPSARIATQNVGFMTYLEFQPFLLKQYPHLSNKNGLIVGNTHLFWHPFGTFERCRQTYMMLHKYKEFTRILSVILGNSKGFYSFFTGDMNSEPFDAPYLSITAKPIEYSGQAKNVLGCSLTYTYSQVRSLEKNEVDENDGLDDEQRENPTDPEPEVFMPTPDQDQLLLQMQNAHNTLKVRAISLYSVGYKLAHPENSGINNDRNEPMFTNWVNTWSGMLDYIFILTDWDNTEDFSHSVDTPEEIADKYNIKLLRLLKLPVPGDMGPKPNGQPRIYQYPSDHLCIMAEVQLL
ncbi:end processing RNAse Ngl2p [Spathaspora passalidarum NRRL Y-27907]|uniref:End processing RNAse Ngl2p n=1 Tax=Spathaspora passalidarum (strain NRRL Y-27907 / 11-Y1) TaxID=619300 RepID=G3AUE8_SPAPN|nr:end processing RNAse Ngl2p [Spathaspora passalidarum NRRL Y-27907]EGW30524.1 end processing RNAse Ngl2p [Spathaspora passalidarum NRRL Y-27907]